MIDKLDLLGVKHDYELEQKAKYEIGEKVYNSWKNKSIEEKKEWDYDIYEYCISNISEEIGYDYDDVIKDETHEIMKIIETEFLKINVDKGECLNIPIDCLMYNIVEYQDKRNDIMKKIMEVKKWKNSRKKDSELNYLNEKRQIMDIRTDELVRLINQYSNIDTSKLW